MPLLAHLVLHCICNREDGVHRTHAKQKWWQSETSDGLGLRVFNNSEHQGKLSQVVCSHPLHFCLLSLSTAYFETSLIGHLTISMQNWVVKTSEGSLWAQKGTINTKLTKSGGNGAWAPAFCHNELVCWLLTLLHQISFSRNWVVVAFWESSEPQKWQGMNKLQPNRGPPKLPAMQKMFCMCKMTHWTNQIFCCLCICPKWWVPNDE